MNPILLAALLLAAAAAAAYLLGSIDFGVVVSRLVYRETCAPGQRQRGRHEYASHLLARPRLP